MTNHMIPEKRKVIYYKKESPDSFTIRLDWKIKHDPGQFVMVSIPGVGECPISICSHSDKYVELNIRQVGNVTNALAKIKKGDVLLARGPYGKGYPMASFKGNNLIIIGGGCGIAPLKGIIEYVETHRNDYEDIMLFLGFRTPKYILFEKEMKTWEKNFDMSVSFDKSEGNSCFSGKIGFITNLVDASQIDNKNKIVFVCGPPIMMKLVVDILKKKGFHEDQIFLSFERHMKCGVQKCGHCMINGIYVCKDGPVFRFDEVNRLSEKW